MGLKFERILDFLRHDVFLPFFDKDVLISHLSKSLHLPLVMNSMEKSRLEEKIKALEKELLVINREHVELANELLMAKLLIHETVTLN